jgi:plasmid replication initiation protein
MKISNKDVIQSYIMTTAKYDFSADEKRILLRLVETWQNLLEGVKLKGRIDKTLFGHYEVEFPISYFVPEGQTNYNRVKDALRSLNEKKFEFEDSKHWEIIRIIEMPHVERREHVKFTLNSKIVDCFLDFTKGYRKFELETSLMFSSVYAMRFYELFSGQKSPLIYTIETLKEMFQIANKYKRAPDFIKYVIDQAKKELDEKSPFSFEYSIIKKGRQFHSIKFYPITIPKNRNEDIEKKELIKQVHLSGFLEKIERDYLKKLGFTERQIKNNINIFIEAKNNLDFMYELSIFTGKTREKKNPQGYIINALKGKLKDKGVKI